MGSVLCIEINTLALRENFSSIDLYYRSTGSFCVLSHLVLLLRRLAQYCQMLLILGKVKWKNSNNWNKHTFLHFFCHDTCAITINRCRRHHFYFAFVVQGSSSSHVLSQGTKKGKIVKSLQMIFESSFSEWISMRNFIMNVPLILILFKIASVILAMEKCFDNIILSEVILSFILYSKLLLWF